MIFDEFRSLSQAQREALLISMVIRNEMEDFHVEHLSDAQMKQLNPIIRQAVFDALNLIFHIRYGGQELDPIALRNMDFQIRYIPDYWEIPERVSDGYTQFEPRTTRTVPEWAKTPSIRPLYDRFIRLGQLKYEFGEDGVMQIEDYLSRTIASGESDSNLRWRAAQRLIDEELKAVINKLRDNKISQQKLIEARGELSRSDLREYF
ncbi:hypothetical protein [Nocardia thraciensis]